MTCRCGHARGLHRATPNAVRKARAAARRFGGVARPQAGCRYMATAPGALKVCRCRDYVPAPEPCATAPSGSLYPREASWGTGPTRPHCRSCGRELAYSKAGQLEHAVPMA